MAMFVWNYVNIITLVSSVLFIVAAISFYNSLKKFTVGYFKEFNKLIWATILLIAISHLGNLARINGFAVVVQIFSGLFALVAALLFIFAAYKLKTMSERFGFAKLDIGSTKMLKPAERKFVHTMMKARRR